MYHTFSQFDPPNDNNPEQRRAPSQAGTQAASPSPQPAPFARSAVHLPISSSGLRSPMAQGQRESPAWDVERQLAAQGHGQPNHVQPRLPNAESQWAGVFTAASPGTCLRPRMRPVLPEDNELPTVGTLMQLSCQQPPSTITRASTVVHPSHSQGECLSQPIHLAPSPSDSLSQPIEFAPSQDNNLAQGPSFAQQGDWIPDLGSLPTSPGSTIDLITPGTSVSPLESGSSAPPSPDTQRQSRAAKGKSVNPKEKASKSKPKPAANKRKANGKKAGSSKRARTSKHADMTASDVSESERVDLDVPMDNFKEDEEKNGETNGETNGEESVASSQRIPVVLQKTMLQWYTERFQENRNDWPGSVKMLELLVKGELTHKQISDWLSRECRHYVNYNRMVMKTGGGRDDFVTKEEMESRHERLNIENSFEWWMDYRESWKFKMFHAVRLTELYSAWDSDDVRKFANFNSTTSTASDDDDKKRSSSKRKGNKKARDTSSGSETERKLSRTKRADRHVFGVIVTGMESLAVNWGRQTDVSEKMYKLEVQRSKNKEAARQDCLTLDKRSRGIEDFIKVVSNLNHEDQLVSSVARRFLVQLNEDMAPPPEQPAPLAAAPVPDVSAPAPAPAPVEPIASSPVPSANTSLAAESSAVAASEPAVATSATQESVASSSSGPVISGSGCSLPSLV
ncbi:hypothetical protein FRC09_000595 [Ceratobasidium sp. 395]|nr:hypothetical protein FRC09_000595 [Ceratobasidium sp. 395]